MVTVIRVRKPGGADALAVEELPVGSPGPGEVLIRQTAIGVNFIDVYQRTGLYKVDLPFVAGNEGVGIVETLGEGVRHLRAGQRVAYANVLGAYAEKRLIAADRLVRVPDGIDDATAAAAMLKGLTAEYLLRRVFPVARGHVVLFHAAAGGVGLIACQWASALGATVIGTVGSRQKATIAAAHGCQHVIDYSAADFVSRVMEITGGRGVDVVFDSVGKDTFPGSLDVLRPRGMWVSFGQSSGPVSEFSPLLLMRKGSLFATRPTLKDYIADPGELQAAAEALFGVIAAGTVKIRIDRTFRLADAALAHAALEARQTIGSVVLLP